jgi:peptidoglycan/xylan/chitin deacetylase (PgdA/CDA1 family)
MPLPEDYLRYPHRAYGMDQSFYAWRPATTRAPLAWPDGKTLAAVIVIPVEFHRLDPVGKPFKHPGAMQTPYPDLRHFTTRDYGLRVGLFRILDALAEVGVRATVPVNAAVLDRIKPAIDAIDSAGHEIAAYGWEADAIHWSGLSREDETERVEAVRRAFDHAGLKPRTWMSPARQQSFSTPELVRAAGFDVCLDWEMDEVPVKMTTATGELWAVPLMNELDDRALLIDRRQSEDEWVAQVLESADYLKSQGSPGDGRVLSFTLTPYVTGQPFRVSSLRKILKTLADDAAVWCATAAEIAAAAAKQL